MEQLFISFFSAAIGGILVSFVREAVITKKENGAGLQISLVVLKNEISKNHNNLMKKSRQDKSIRDHIIGKQVYGYNKDDFTITNWEKVKVDITKLNPYLGKTLYGVYTLYEELIEKNNTVEIREEMVTEYERNYELLLIEFKVK